MNKLRRSCLFRNSIFALLIQLTCWLNGQNIANYVNNGSFEDTINVNYIRPKFWGALDSGKYFGLFLRAPIQVPLNSFGFQQPKIGKNYLISIFYSTTSNKGYPRNKLKSNLVQGKTYCVTFYVALSNQSTHGIDAIGAYFGDNSLDTVTKCNGPITYLTPQITNPTQNIITDTLFWTAITGTFVASGTEKYMVIGNFKSDASTNTTLTNTLNLPANFADYYLDGVSVIDSDLPAYAGLDKSCIPGDSVFIGRVADVGIDEACTWYQLPNTATPMATVAGLYVKPVQTTTYVVRQQLWCSGVKYDTVIIYKDAVGVEKFKNIENNLIVYPQPAKSILICQMPRVNLGREFTNYIIYNESVAELKSDKIAMGQEKIAIDISELHTGIYLLRLLDTDTGFSVMRRFVVE
jgi:hypothetical protein